MPNFQPNYIYSPLYGNRYLGGSRAHAPSTGTAGQVENTAVQRAATVGVPYVAPQEVSQGQPIGWSGTGRDQSAVSSLGDFGFVPKKSLVQQGVMDTTDNYFDVPELDFTGSFQVPTTGESTIPSFSYGDESDNSVGTDYGQGILPDSSVDMDLAWGLYDLGTNAPVYAPGMKIFGELVGGAMLDSQIENISDSYDAMENVPTGLQTTSDAAGNVTYVYAPDSLASESNLDANDYAKFADSITSQGGNIVGLDASGNVVATKPDGTTVRSQAGGNSVNFNITDVVTKEFGDQGDPAPSQDLSTNVTDYLDIDDTFETPIPDIPDIDSTYTSGSGNDGSDNNYNSSPPESPQTSDELDADSMDSGVASVGATDIDSSYTSSGGNDGSDNNDNNSGNDASDNYGGGWDDGYWSEGGYIPASQSITQGMSMGNVTKFTQKDRYGNMLSIEFDVPKQMEIPHPGQPIGTDTVPAWLTPGERVMNAEAERMYGPILKDMNDQGRALQAAQGGTIPEYAASGCKVQYEYDGGPVYAQGGGRPDEWFYDPRMLDALRQVESGGDPNAVSKAGAIGPYQILPSTAANPGYNIAPISLEDAKDEEKSRRFAMSYLAALQANNPELSPEQILQMYNAGEGRIRADIAGTGKKPLKQETIDYGDKVLKEFGAVPSIDNVIQTVPEVAESINKSEIDPNKNYQIGYLNTDIFEKDGKFGDLRIPPNPASGPIKSPSILENISNLIDEANEGSGIGQIQKRNKELAEENRKKRAMEGNASLTAAMEDIGIIPDIIDADDETISLTEIPNPQRPSRRERAQRQRESTQEGEGWTSDMAEGSENRKKAQEQRLAEKRDGVESLVESQAGRQEDIVGGRSDKAKETDVATQETTKENAVKGLESTTDPSDTPTKDPNEVEKDAKKATPEQKEEAKSFFDEWGLSELFNKKEIGKMMALYLGSRALGYSHNGSLNFAAKNYVTGIERISKVADKLAVEGKHTKDSIKEYRKSGDMTDLILKPVKPKRISAEPLTYFVEGASFNKGRVKLYEWEDQATKSKYLGDAAGNPIDMSKVHNEVFRVEGSPEYNKRIRASINQIKPLFAEFDKNLNRGGDADGDPRIEILPESATQQAAKWAVVNDLDVTEVEGLVRGAYSDALAQKQRDPKTEISDIRPFLNQQVIRSYTGNPNLLQYQNDDGEFVPIDSAKLTAVNKAIATRVGTQWKDLRVNDLMNQYMASKEQEWVELGKNNPTLVDKYNNRANEGENGFLLFMLDDFGLLDKGRMK